MPAPRPVETVRLMLEARLADDVKALRSLLHPKIRESFATDDGERRTEVHAHRIEADGDDVVAYGRIRVVERGSVADSPAAWRFRVRDGVVVSIAPEAP